MSVHSNYALFRSEVAEAQRTRVEGEVVLTRPLRSHILVLLLVAAVALMTAWVALGEYARTETVRGILVTRQPSAKVVAVRPGQISSLAVREGDRVIAGQRLAIVQVEQPNEAGGSSVGDGLNAIDAQRGLARDQLRLAGERAASERTRLAAILSGIAQQRADLAGQREIQRELVGSAQDMLQRLERVVEKGFVSRVEVERRRQAWLGSRQQLAQLQQQINALDAEERRVGAELGRVEAESGSERATALTSAETLLQQRARLQGERAYVILAPITGRVAALQTAVGRTAEPNIPLMEILPDESSLLAVVYAPTRAIGFVRPGQEVRLLYDAFPYQRFGSFGGRIARISRVVIDPRQLAAPLRVEEPVYQIEVLPNSQAIAAFGDRVPLQPGMTLTANIILERRSFRDWLLAPLNAVIRRNG